MSFITPMGLSERIPIVYGRNLVNWWSFPAVKEEPTGARAAWTGSSDATDMNAGIKIRVFATTWTNPHPEKEVATLDILSAGTGLRPVPGGRHPGTEIESPRDSMLTLRLGRSRLASATPGLQPTAARSILNETNGCMIAPKSDKRIDRSKVSTQEPIP